MTKHRFEIVRQTHDRYSWLFVEVEDGQRRVLARGDRDYGSPKKVRRAIQELQGAVPYADVAELERFALPATSFRLVPGVVPLVVEESPVERDIAVVRRRKPKRLDSSAKLRKRTEEAAEAVVLEDAAQQEAAEAVVLEDAAQQEAAEAVVLEDAAQQEAAKAKAPSRAGRRRKAT
jgi:hypothetical protein